MDNTNLAEESTHKGAEVQPLDIGFGQQTIGAAETPPKSNQYP